MPRQVPKPLEHGAFAAVTAKDAPRQVDGSEVKLGAPLAGSNRFRRRQVSPREPRPTEVPPQGTCSTASRSKESEASRGCGVTAVAGLMALVSLSTGG